MGRAHTRYRYTAPAVGALEPHLAPRKCVKSQVSCDRTPSGCGKRSRGPEGSKPSDAAYTRRLRCPRAEPSSAKLSLSFCKARGTLVPAWLR